MFHAPTLRSQHQQRIAPPAAGWLTLLQAYGPVVALLLSVAALGLLGIGVARLLFVVGCFAVAVLAYQTGGPSRHVEICIVLFVLGPFLRRIMDLRLGYDEGSTVLVGPLLALTAAYPELRQLISSKQKDLSFLPPFILAFICVTYGWTASAFGDKMLLSTIAATKYAVPMLYSICLILRPDQSDRVLSSAARMFLILCPIIGVYGIIQYSVLPSWDRLWIIAAKIPSNGYPEPEQFRVFSTMNSPSSFAVYAGCGIMLFSFIRSFLPPILVPFFGILPLSVAFMLSGIRTSWITTAIALSFCLLFNLTRKRAAMMIFCLGIGIFGTLTLTPFSDSVSKRIETLSNGVSQDGSGSERLHDYIHVFTEGNRYLFGVGFAASDQDPNLSAYDGQLLFSVIQMGLVFGILHTAAILWAGAQALFTLRYRADVTRLVVGSLIVSYMSVFLLLAFSYGEMGFLYWMLVGGLTAVPKTRHGIAA